MNEAAKRKFIKNQLLQLEEYKNYKPCFIKIIVEMMVYMIKTADVFPNVKIQKYLIPENINFIRGMIVKEYTNEHINLWHLRSNIDIKNYTIKEMHEIFNASFNIEDSIPI